MSLTSAASALERDSEGAARMAIKRRALLVLRCDCHIDSDYPVEITEFPLGTIYRKLRSVTYALDSAEKPFHPQHQCSG